MAGVVTRGEMAVFSKTDGSAVICLTGNWKKGAELPGSDEALEKLESKPPLLMVTFDASGLTGWDSHLLIFIKKMKDHLKERGIECRTDALPEGVTRLLNLVVAVPERPAAKIPHPEPFITAVGGRTAALAGSASAGLDPISARTIDDLILQIRDSFGSTFVVVTHELTSIFAIGSDSYF